MKREDRPGRFCRALQVHFLRQAGILRRGRQGAHRLLQNVDISLRVQQLTIEAPKRPTRRSRA